MYEVETIKPKAVNSRTLPLRVVKKNGVPVGFVRKFKDTKWDKSPWQAFVYETEFVPGETSGKLVANFWSAKNKPSGTYPPDPTPNLVGGVSDAIEEIKNQVDGS